MTTSTSVVDVHTTKTFTEEHLETSKHFINEETRPEWYGPKFTFGKDLGRKLVPMSDVKWLGQYENTQTPRSAGGNTKYKDIRNSIYEFGFKLNNDPIALWQTSQGLYPITGYTRKDILSNLGFTNIIANVYELTPENYSLLGSIFNRGYDPQGVITKYDIQTECLHAIKQKWIKPEFNDILDRVNKICGNGLFTNHVRNYIVTAVYTSWQNKKPGAKEIYSWTTDTAINNWLTKNKYIDSQNVVYLTTSYSQVSKAIIRAAELSAENSDKQVRVVVHTGVLDAYDLKKCYDKRVNTFKEKWDTWLTDIRVAFFNSKPLDTETIILYGALPAMGEHHNLDKIIRYKKQSKIIVNGTSEESEENAE
jgi:hypothetical protein|tara:strand:+ start:116 stop:1210 length:1095 start_codon:yes stop_codon:yes gene_type:complete